MRREGQHHHEWLDLPPTLCRQIPTSDVTSNCWICQGWTEEVFQWVRIITNIDVYILPSSLVFQWVRIINIDVYILPSSLVFQLVRRRIEEPCVRVMLT